MAVGCRRRVRHGQVRNPGSTGAISDLAIESVAFSLSFKIRPVSAHPEFRALASRRKLRNYPVKMKKTKSDIEKAPKTLHRVHSSLVIDGADRAPSRAMLHAVGLSGEDFKKSQIGI